MKRSHNIEKQSKRRLRMMLCLLLLMFMVTQTVAADEESDNQHNMDLVGDSEHYSAVVYDNTNGLPTAVANDVAHTEEGFIWIGSYAGLIRYDGANFDRIDSTNGVNSVGCICVDSKDRLWFGTNENGAAMMEKGEFRWFGENEGMRSSKVRDITEGADGSIYAGTINGIAMITPDFQVKMLDQPEIANVYVEEMKLGSDGKLYCISSEGDYFVISGDQLVTYIPHKQTAIRKITSVLPDPDNQEMIYIGTERSKIYYCKTGEHLSKVDKIDVSPLAGVNYIQKIGDKVWICARNGIGMIDDKGFHHMSDLPFKFSVTNVIEDYQGNLWFSSSRQGVMKLTPNRFTDVFARYEIPGQVTNSTRMYENKLFVGLETGLLVLDENGPVENVPVTEARYASGEAYPATNLIKELEGSRIRSMIRDSKDRLWISTWQASGLLRYDHGKLTLFREEDGLPSDRIRVVSEAADGSMACACTGGVCVIKDDAVTAVYDESTGIAVKETLTVTAAPNGDILAGSNGGGLYIIGKDGVRCIDRKDGLTSGVVMRIKYNAEHDLFWIITGNSIAYLTSDYKVTTIKHFPYPDNLDIYENKSGDLWILSSDGIYITTAENLIADDEIKYTHYGIRNGLPCSVVSNSYSEVTEEGDLYISGNTGVVKVNIDEPGGDVSAIKQAISYLVADNRRYYPDENGDFKIPAIVRKLTINGFIFNYSLSDPTVSCQLEGFDRHPMTFLQSSLHPMIYTNLRGGTYRYVMKIKDELGNDKNEVAVTIVKQKLLVEYFWFYVIAALLLLLLVFLIVKWYVRQKTDKLEEKHREESEKERVNRELQMANRIQMSMLPHDFPPFPDRTEFELYASMDPAREVGGDFYDYFLIDEDHLCLVIADVSGKGIPASLFMMNSKVVLQTIAKTGLSVEKILSSVNNAICANNQLEMFITVWIGILELSTGKLVAANAGHEYPAVKRADGSFELFKDKHGFVLGGMEDLQYHGYELQLKPGDKIFVYTDGVVEATNADNGMFGTDLMLAALNSDAEASPEKLLEIVDGAVSDFVKEAEQFDDMTMLCLEYKG